METLKQLVSSFIQGYAMGLVLNGTLITLVYFVVWQKLKPRLQRYRIQLKQRVDAKQLKREIKNAFTTLAVGSLLSTLVIYLGTLGYTKIYTRLTDYNPLFAIGSFFLLLLIDDAWFYWLHRLLHHPAIYRYIHAEHHKSIDVNPYTSMSFHFLEPLLLTLWIVPVACFIPVYAPVLLVVQLWGLLDNIKSHLGYELYPAWFNRSWLRFLTSSTHHNMHHSKFNGNYGVHLRLWDKWMGTEFADYETEYDKIKQRNG